MKANIFRLKLLPEIILKVISFLCFELSLQQFTEMTRLLLVLAIVVAAFVVDNVAGEFF